MSELQELEVVIKPNGELKVEIRGVKGEKCLDITKEMEALLGNDIVERDLTDEYYAQGNALTDDDLLRQGGR